MKFGTQLILFVIVIVIFILFYIFGCFSYSRTNVAHSFLFRTFLLAPFYVTFFSFKMSVSEFSHVFLCPSFPCYPGLPYLFLRFAIIHPHQMTKPLELLFMYFLQCRFNFQFSSHHFVSYSVSSRNSFYSS